MNENLTKAIRILDPVDSIWRFRCRGITQYIVKCHIRSIHDIDTPERRLFNEEILHRHVADVPENESIGRLGCVFSASAVYQTSPLPLIPPVP